MKPRWCYFKKGSLVTKRKTHCLPTGKWTSICGMFVVRPEERKFIVFVEKSKLRQSKLCNNCQSKENSFLFDL